MPGIYIVKPLTVSRQETELVQADGEIWVLQEPAVAYGGIRWLNIGRKCRGNCFVKARLNAKQVRGESR